MHTGIDEPTINLSELGELVVQGEDAIIGKAGKPLFRVVLYDISGREVEDSDDQTKPRKTHDALRGRMRMMLAFDETRRCFTRAFYNSAVFSAVFAVEGAPGEKATRAFPDCDCAP